MGIGKHATTKSPASPTYNAQWSGVSYSPHCPNGCACPICNEPLHLEGYNEHYCPVCDNYVNAGRVCSGPYV